MLTNYQLTVNLHQLQVLQPLLVRTLRYSITRTSLPILMPKHIVLTEMLLSVRTRAQSLLDLTGQYSAQR